MNNETFLAELAKIGEASKAKGLEIDKQLTALADSKKSSDARLLDLEQRILVRGVGDNTYHGAGGPTIGGLLAGDVKVKELREGNATKITMPVPQNMKMLVKSILGNVGATAGGLTEYPTPTVVVGGPRFTARKLSVLAALPSVTVGGATADVPSLFSNSDSAAVQQKEGDVKAETSLDFANVTLRHATIAHFLTASKQVLADVPMLAQFLDTVLVYGCLKKFESLVVNGVGGVDGILGLVTAGTSYAPGSAHAADAVGAALTELDATGFSGDLIILNPQDRWAMISERDATAHQYIGRGWAGSISGGLWGVNTATSPAVPANTAIVMDTSSVSILDREQANVSIGFQSQQFVMNLITILCEMRGQLAVFNKGGILVTALPAAA